MKPGKKRRERWDEHGLVLIIQAKTGAKSWAYRYRDGRRMVKLNLGPYDGTGKQITGEPQIGAPLTVAAARRLVTALEHERKGGKDIVAAHRAVKRKREGGGDAFPSAVKLYAVQKRAKGVRGWAATARVLGLDFADPDKPATIKGSLCDRWRDKGIKDIDFDMIAAVVDEAISRAVPGREARNPGEHSEARGRELAAALSSLFGHFKKKYWVKVNPVTSKPDKAAARERVLSDQELRVVLLAAETMGAPWSQFIHVLALTGARRDEISDLRWSEWNDDLLSLPATRVKNKHGHEIPLAPRVVELLRSLPREGEFVFSTCLGKRPISGFSKLKTKLDAKSGVTDWRTRTTCVEFVPAGLNASELRCRSPRRSSVTLPARSLAWSEFISATNTTTRNAPHCCAGRTTSRLCSKARRRATSTNFGRVSHHRV